MIRVSSVVVVLLGLAVDVARADGPPCAEERAAVKTRDPSLAEPANASAKQHMEAAKRAYGVQQYETAIDEYTAAGLVDEAPVILYDLGQTYRNANEYEKAIRAYELFIERGKPGKDLRALVECWVSTMKAELDHAAATAPPTGPDEDPSAQPDEPTPVPPAEPSDDRRRPSRWTATRKVALGVAIVGIGGLATGAVFGVQAADLRNQADALCPMSPCGDANEANALVDRASARSTLGLVSAGAGAALVAGAVALWFIGAPAAVAATEDAHATLVPALGATFAGLAYAGTF